MEYTIKSSRHFDRSGEPEGSAKQNLFRQQITELSFIDPSVMLCSSVGMTNC